MSSFRILSRSSIGWDCHYQDANDNFAAQIPTDLGMALFKGKMFYVWNRNHKLMT
jgi:hypothetical protein